MPLRQSKGGRSKTEALYYRITVRDNGCGMKHEQIPNFLGRVLSGSKYGVRQTRGKVRRASRAVPLMPCSRAL